MSHYKATFESDTVEIGVQTVASGSRNFFVAVTGDDSLDGSLLTPFATIGRAKQAVAEFLKNDNTTDVFVYLRGGEYRLEETLVLGLEDGGRGTQRVTYCNYPYEQPVITSSIEINGWQNIGGKLWETTVPENLDIKTLYRDGKLLQRAKSQAYSSNRTTGYYGSSVEHSSIFFPTNIDLSVVNNPTDLEIMTISAAPWAYAVLPVQRIDNSAHLLYTPYEYTYALGKPIYWGQLNDATVLENHRSFFKNDGDWAIDKHQKKLFLCSDVQPSKITAPSLTEYFRLEGYVDHAAATDTPVKNITLRGLTFANFERYSFYSGFRGHELQHAWSLYDYHTAAVRLRGAEDCTIEQCTFSEGGSDAVRLDLHCSSNTVFGNRIYNIGGSGIVLAGYSAGTKNVNHHNKVSNNIIENIGLIYKQSIGIFAWQSGYNLISNNSLKYLPYSAIVVSSRIVFSSDRNIETAATVRYNEISTSTNTFEQQKDYLFGWYNRIEYNDISFVCTKMIDGNGIYISGTGDFNSVYRNYLHDISSSGFMGAIRADDNQYNTTIAQNIIYNTGDGNGIENKQINNIQNNFLIDLKIDKYYWFAYLTNQLAPVKGTRFERNICYDTQGSKLWYNQPLYGAEFDPFDVYMAENLYFSTVNANWSRQHFSLYRNAGSEQGSLFVNPLFYSVEDRDFRLLPDSPAFDMGITQFDLSRIGTLKNYGTPVQNDIFKLYINCGDVSSVAHLNIGNVADMTLSAKNSLGQFVNLRGLSAELYSEDSSIAYINEKGQIQAKKEGRTFVHGEVRQGSNTHTVRIAVVVDNRSIDSNITNENNN